MNIDIERWTGVETAALRHAKRMSIDDFAEAVGVTPGAVDRWEAKAADANIRPANQAKLDDLLAELGPGAENRLRRTLGLPEPLRDAGGAGVATLEHGGHAPPTGIAIPGEVVYVPLSRRRFIAGAGAMAFGGAALPDADYLGYFSQLRTQVINDDNLFGAPGVVTTVEQAIERMRTVRRAGLVDNAAILRTQIIYAEFAAWLYQDMQEFDKAQNWANRAMRWSVQLGDDYCTSFVLIRQASIAADSGDGDDAVDLAHAAQRYAPPDSKLVAAAATFGAHGHALQGDGIASGREYERARAVVADADTDPTWAFWLDQPYIDVHEAHSLTVLGHHRAALDQFAASLNDIPSSWARDRGVYQGWQACAQLGVGDADGAAALANDALSIGIGTRSARILHQVSAVHDQLDDASEDPAVVQLRAAMKKLTN